MALGGGGLNAVYPYTITLTDNNNELEEQLCASHLCRLFQSFLKSTNPRNPFKMS